MLGFLFFERLPLRVLPLLEAVTNNREDDEGDQHHEERRIEHLRIKFHLFLLGLIVSSLQFMNYSRTKVRRPAAVCAKLRLTFALPLFRRNIFNPLERNIYLIRIVRIYVGSVRLVGRDVCPF